jgi:Type IV secretion system pilin
MKKTILISVFLLALFLSSSQMVLADTVATKVNTCGDDAATSGYNCTSETTGLTCVSNKCLAEAANVKCCKGGGASLPNPLGTTNINTFAATLINNILGFVGTISLLLFIYGGLIWMTSAGAPAKVKQGRDILVWAVIGMAVVFTSYILVKFVIQGVQGII